MLENIAPAVEAITEPADASQRTSANIDFVNAVGAKNVALTIERIRKEVLYLLNWKPKVPFRL